MKFKTVIIFIAITMTACFQGQFEKNQALHIKDFEEKIIKIMGNYVEQSQLINTAEEILGHHETALEDFKKIREDFSKYKDENKLETIISLYNYSFTYLIHKQVEFIESALPIWDKNISTLEKIKDVAYFQQHQQLLKGMISQIDEDKKAISEHHENVRKMLVSSNLQESDRKRLWPLFNELTTKHMSSLILLIHPIQTRIESEIEMSSFFYKNRDGYVVSKEKGLEFLSFEMLDSYNRKLKVMNEKYNKSRVISRLANP